jgi:hypothetical protein
VRAMMSQVCVAFQLPPEQLLSGMGGMGTHASPAGTIEAERERTALFWRSVLIPGLETVYWRVYSGKTHVALLTEACARARVRLTDDDASRALSMGKHVEFMFRTKEFDFATAEKLYRLGAYQPEALARKAILEYDLPREDVRTPSDPIEMRERRMALKIEEESDAVPTKKREKRGDESGSDADDDEEARRGRKVRRKMGISALVDEDSA